MIYHVSNNYTIEKNKKNLEQHVTLKEIKNSSLTKFVRAYKPNLA